MVLAHDGVVGLECKPEKVAVGVLFRLLVVVQEVPFIRGRIFNALGVGRPITADYITTDAGLV